MSRIKLIIVKLFDCLFGKKNNCNKETSISMQPIHVSNKIPLLQGDYAKTIFLWHLKNASPIFSKNKYPAYLLYECGITNPVDYHKNLITEGYFSQASKADILNSFTISQLKEILDNLKLKKSGNKKVLIERIIGTENNEIFFDEYKNLYSLSAKGKDFLKVHDAYIQLHQNKHFDISWQEYDNCLATLPNNQNLKFFDVVWAILNKRLTSDNTNFGRNEYNCMYEILTKEGRRKEALRMLLRIIYIDFNGTELWFSLKDVCSTKKEFLSSLSPHDFESTIFIVPDLIESLLTYADVYDDSIVDDIYTQKLPFKIVNKTLFKKIIHNVLNGNYDLETVENELRTAYLKFIN